MNNWVKKTIVAWLSILLFGTGFAQENDLLALVRDDHSQKVPVTGAFKSSRVINNHSMELIGKGVMDVRILHRFGLLKSGIGNLFGLDQATMRFGFDYGISKNLTMGLGRSTFHKEWDGFLKWRILQQSEGRGASPLSIIWISGMTVNTVPAIDASTKRSIVQRSGYYHEVILGRKFSERFSLQLSPILVHRNLLLSEKERNDVYALGVGGRFKLSKRVALVADYDYVASGIDKAVYTNPLSIGFDIETGGHVFQLHFSNSLGMDERAFITETSNQWTKGDINFGFNLSRVFSGKRRKDK